MIKRWRTLNQLTGSAVKKKMINKTKKKQRKCDKVIHTE